MKAQNPPVLVAWRPRGRGNFLCEGPKQRALLAAIKDVKGEKIDHDNYFLLLGERVQAMLDAEDDPEMAPDEMYDALWQEDIAEVPKPRIDRVGSELIYGNFAFRHHCGFLGLPGKLPKQLLKNDPKAAQVIEETGLECWWHTLLAKPYDPDR